MDVTKTVIYKDLLRFVKDKGLYSKFINTFTFKEILLRKSGRDLLYMLNYKGICEHNEFLKYYYKKHEKEFITEFEIFLNDNNIKKHFQENINEMFIKQYTYNSFKQCKTKSLTLYNNILPDGYIEYAFLWSETKYGTRKTWMELNEKWRKKCIKIYDK